MSSDQQLIGPGAPTESVQPIRALSLGAGVQSTAILLLALHGEIPPIDVAVFADTQWEPAEVYRHFEWLKREVGGRIPIVEVTSGDVRSRWWQMPVYTDAETGDEGRVSRNCSRDFKVAPIRRHLRPLYLAQAKPRPPIDHLLGFSLDEFQRASDSPVKYLRNRFPLLYERPMTRGDCLAWMDAKGYPEPPKSACIGCPMRDDASWAGLDPGEFAQAVELDTHMRRHDRTEGPKRPAYLHRRGPLATVALRPKPDPGEQLGLAAAACDSGAGCWT